MGWQNKLSGHLVDAGEFVFYTSLFDMFLVKYFIDCG